MILNVFVPKFPSERVNVPEGHLKEYFFYLKQEYRECDMTYWESCHFIQRNLRKDNRGHKRVAFYIGSSRNSQA